MSKPYSDNHLPRLSRQRLEGSLRSSRQSGRALWPQRRSRHSLFQLSYPARRVKQGRRELWLRDDLDHAILPPELVGSIPDAAGDLDYDQAPSPLRSLQAIKKRQDRVLLDAAELLSSLGLLPFIGMPIPH